ncbi:MAG TPA: hypothetical protein VMJ72_00205 [Candidatus Paceibacterota bacterium]|nr:hypothetical protein [Candidatus Paceibacterota bacterium]
MRFSALEQMRRYGVLREDITTALKFSQRLAEFDTAIFPDDPCALQMTRNGGLTGCAQYVTMPGNGEMYVLYVEHVTERLRAQAARLIAEHAHQATVGEDEAFRLITDAIALHEVRHRLQEHRGPSLERWVPFDLDAKDELAVMAMLTNLAPEKRTPREVDALIVEFLYVTARLSGHDDFAEAVRREPR